MAKKDMLMTQGRCDKNCTFRHLALFYLRTNGMHTLRSLKQQGFKSTLLVKSVKKFFKRHCTTMVKYNVALRELRLAVLDWGMSQLIDVSFACLRFQVFYSFLSLWYGCQGHTASESTHWKQTCARAFPGVTDARAFYSFSWRVYLGLWEEVSINIDHFYLVVFKFAISNPPDKFELVLG